MENEPRLPESLLNILENAELNGKMDFAIKKAYVTDPEAKILIDKKIANTITSEEKKELLKRIEAEYDRLDEKEKLGPNEISFEGDERLN